VGKSTSLKQYESIGRRWGNTKILHQSHVCVGVCIPVIFTTAWKYQGKAGENFAMVNLGVLLQEPDEKQSKIANWWCLLCW